MMSSDNNEKEKEKLAALVIDGGHFVHAMASVTTKCAKKYNVNPQDIQVNIDILLPELERQFGIQFNLYQQFFYQGTFSGGINNEFHKRLKRNNINVGIHDMKKQHGKSTEVFELESNKPVVAAFLKAQKFIVLVSCGIFLAPIPIILKIILLASIIYVEVYHGIRFFDLFQLEKFQTIFPKNGKLTIWVERGVDVQIAAKMIECSHALNGNPKPSKLIVITGDSDLKSAFMCSNDASNMSGNIIVLAEDNCLATCLESYLPYNKQITLESIMEACLTWTKGGGLVAPRLRASAKIAPPSVSKSEITTAQNPNAFEVSPIQTNAVLNSAVDVSLEIALALHQFIATKYENKSFFSVDMAFFYTSGNEPYKTYIQKHKIKSICDAWPELLKLDWSVPSKGAMVLLGDSQRSQELVNHYFSNNVVTTICPKPEVTSAVSKELFCDTTKLVHLKTADNSESILTEVKNAYCETTRNKSRDEHRNEPRDNNRSEPRDDYRNEPRHEYRNESKDNYRNEPRDEYRNEPKDNYRNEPREDYRNEPREDYRNDPREDYRNDPRNDYRSEPRDNYRSEPRDNYRSEPREPRDDYRNEPRSSRRNEPKEISQNDGKDKHTYRNTVSSRHSQSYDLRQKPKVQSVPDKAPNKVPEKEPDDSLLLMRQMKVVWDGVVPIREFLCSKCEILEQLTLSVEEILNLIKNCFEDDIFETCFSDFELKYNKTNYKSVGKLRKEIIKVVDNEQSKHANQTEELLLTPELSLESVIENTAVSTLPTLTTEEETVLFLHETVQKNAEVELEDTCAFSATDNFFLNEQLTNLLQTTNEILLTKLLLATEELNKTPAVEETPE